MKPLTPWADEADFGLVEWMIRGQLKVAQIDEYLKLARVSCSWTYRLINTNRQLDLDSRQSTIVHVRQTASGSRQGDGIRS